MTLVTVLCAMFLWSILVCRWLDLCQADIFLWEDLSCVRVFRLGLNPDIVYFYMVQAASLAN